MKQQLLLITIRNRVSKNEAIIVIAHWNKKDGIFFIFHRACCRRRHHIYIYTSRQLNIARDESQHCVPTRAKSVVSW